MFLILEYFWIPNCQKGFSGVACPWGFFSASLAPLLWMAWCLLWCQHCGTVSLVTSYLFNLNLCNQLLVNAFCVSSPALHTRHIKVNETFPLSLTSIVLLWNPVNAPALLRNTSAYIPVLSRLTKIPSFFSRDMQLFYKVYFIPLHIQHYQDSLWWLFTREFNSHIHCSFLIILWLEYIRTIWFFFPLKCFPIT